MAFTTGEKIKILKFLGWPANTINPDTLSYSKIVSDRLLLVLPEAEEEVKAYLDRLDAIELSLVAAVDSTGVKKIDDIEFFGSQDGGTKLSALRSERNRIIKELAIMLDISCHNMGGLPTMGNVRR